MKTTTIKNWLLAAVGISLVYLYLADRSELIRRLSDTQSQAEQAEQLAKQAHYDVQQLRQLNAAMLQTIDGLAARNQFAKNQLDSLQHRYFIADSLKAKNTQLLKRKIDETIRTLFLSVPGTHR